MYRRALDILGSRPQRTLFIDDREENVAGAAAAGMKAIRFTGAEALRRENLGQLWECCENCQGDGGLYATGLIGLGKMGGNMAERLKLAGHQVVGFDFNADAVAKLTEAGNLGVSSLEDLAKNLNGRESHLDHGAAGQAGGRYDRQAGAAAESRATF